MVIVYIVLQEGKYVLKNQEIKKDLRVCPHSIWILTEFLFS